MARAAGFGAGANWVLSPPVSKADAEKEFGMAISEGAWDEICVAFKLHGRRLSKLEGTWDNRNPNDARGWHKRLRDAESALDTALSALDKINRDFLMEAENNVSLKRSSDVETYGALQRLNNAMEEILFLSWLVSVAEPISCKIMTKSESRKALARDIFAALKSAGATISNGWAMDQAEPSYADLSGFVRLAELLEIHQGTTPKATAKWLREAFAQNR